MATTRHKSLVERGGRLHTPKKKGREKNVRKNPIFSNLKISIWSFQQSY